MSEESQNAKAEIQALPYRMSREKFDRALAVMKQSPGKTAALDVALGKSDRPFVIRSLQILGLATSTLELTPAGRRIAWAEKEEREQAVARTLMEFEPYRILIMDAIRRKTKSLTVKDVASLWGQHGRGATDELRTYGSTVFLTLLEAGGLGKYSVGRRGNPSRIEFLENLQERATAAYSEMPPTPPTPAPDPVSLKHGGESGVLTTPNSFVGYQLLLRPNLVIRVDLPRDLSRRDVERLTKWLSTLPLEETAE